MITPAIELATKIHQTNLMTVWIKKAVNRDKIDVLLRDFDQHFYSMHQDEEMVMIKAGEISDPTVFICLSVERHTLFYPGFVVCSEDDLPAFFKLLRGSPSKYRCLLQKRVANGKTVAEQAK